MKHSQYAFTTDTSGHAYPGLVRHERSRFASFCLSSPVVVPDPSLGFLHLMPNLRGAGISQRRKKGGTSNTATRNCLPFRSHRNWGYITYDEPQLKNRSKFDGVTVLCVPEAPHSLTCSWSNHNLHRQHLSGGWLRVMSGGCGRECC